MKTRRACPECSGSNIYTTTVSAGGRHAPDLLPGAHPWYKGGQLEVYVCTDCGHFEQFVPHADLQRVRDSKKFKRAV